MADITVRLYCLSHSIKRFMAIAGTPVPIDFLGMGDGGSPLKQLDHIMFAKIQFYQPSQQEASYAFGWGRVQLPSRFGQIGLNPTLLPKGMPTIELRTDFVGLAEAAVIKNLKWYPRVVDELEKGRKAGTLPKPLTEYAGNYWDELHIFKIDVRLVRHKLYWLMQGLETEMFELAHCREDTFTWLQPRDELASRGRWVGSDQGATFRKVNFGAIQCQLRLSTEYHEQKPVLSNEQVVEDVLKDSVPCSCLDGIDLWYATFGRPLKETKAKGLSPVVFLHGGFANSDYWANQIRYFKDHPYTLITIDSRARVVHVIGLMDHLGIEKFSTVGWSDGACISFDLAMNFTSRLDRAFAFGGTYSPANINSTVGDSPVFTEYLERAEAEWKKMTPSKGSFQDFSDRMNTMWADLSDWDAKSFATIPTRYSNPNAPIMWIVDGESEEAVNRTVPAELHSWIWGSDLLLLPGVSHFAQDPKTFNVNLERFLEMPRFPGEL
ncbi:hypothetical protein FCOIX_12394 [Fusarium coicis]|nr:hypothetical protein FCOIX_12394 [Fusarium coicis]